MKREGGGAVWKEVDKGIYEKGMTSLRIKIFT
jgi:hypothetical protein